MRDDPPAYLLDAVSVAGLVSTHGKDHAGVGSPYLPQIKSLLNLYKTILFNCAQDRNQLLGHDAAPLNSAPSSTTCKM